MLLQYFGHGVHIIQHRGNDDAVMHSITYKIHTYPTIATSYKLYCLPHITYSVTIIMYLVHWVHSRNIANFSTSHDHFRILHKTAQQRQHRRQQRASGDVDVGTLTHCLWIVWMKLERSSNDSTTHYQILCSLSVES